MSKRSAAKHNPKSKGKSRVTNGADLLPNVDGRSETARRYRDIMVAVTRDQGGADTVSETKLSLIRRFASASVMAEQQEAALARGEAFDLQEFCALASTIVRLAARIGLGRGMKNVTPTLDEYLATSFKRDPVNPEKAAEP